MNYSDKNFAKVSLSEKSLNLMPFLAFCREIKKIYPQNTKIINHWRLNEININEGIKHGMLDFKNELIHILSTTEVPFYPFFIELSLFDPEDRTGKTFYSLLFSDNENALSSYFYQMGCNLTEANISARPRSPIIPNKHLHEYIYYSLHIETNTHNNIYFNELQPDSDWMSIGHYNIDNAKDELLVETKEELSRSISGFLQDVSDQFTVCLKNENGRHIYNYAALIPLFRPAATFKGEDERIYNGGGLFVYGHLADQIKEDRFILEVQSNITKSIFQTSHSQIAFDEKDNLIKNIELKLIHQIKNKLSHRLIEKLKDLRTNIECDATSQKEMDDTINFTEELITKLTHYLNSFGKALQMSEDSIISINEIKLAIESKASQFNIPVVIISEADNNTFQIKIDISIFQFIMEELVMNASREYNKKININKEKKMKVYLFPDKSLKFVLINIQSMNLDFLDPDKLPAIGKFPLANTTSTGFGLYLINKVLEQAGAIRFPDGRFLSPKNTETGSTIAIQLPINENTKTNK
ncbi:MAG TPA: hypothetical protein DHV28_07640 [Ignavibacteriales bacterium]|nr:hypothetical protein [Ignavibacteriales bacterium]